MELAACEDKIIVLRDGAGRRSIPTRTRNLRGIDFPSRGGSRLRNTDRNYQKIAGDGEEVSAVLPGVQRGGVLVRKDKTSVVHFIPVSLL